MRKTNGRICGGLEARRNRFMRMCLEWQYDRWHNISHTNEYYFTKYHVGKYKAKYFKNLHEVLIDRDYIIDLMDTISNDRKEYDKVKTNENSKRQVLYAD